MFGILLIQFQMSFIKIPLFLTLSQLLHIEVGNIS